MSAAVGLVPLECVRCSTPVPAEPDQVAWVCANCGQGLVLDEETGLRPLAVQFGAGEPQSGVRWRPFWVAVGRVTISNRETYGRARTSDPLWAKPVRFVIPAFALPVEQAVAWGTQSLRKPPDLKAGAAVLMEPATVPPQTVLPLARFVVLSIEADRPDQLEQIGFVVDLDEPELWCLPVASG